MKDLCKILAVCLLFVSCFSFCYADDIPVEVQALTDGSGNENPSGTVYINNYDDYESVANEVNGVPQDDEYNEQLKQYYEEYRDYLKDYYDDYTRPEYFKAKVTEVVEIKDEYQVDYQTYNISKYKVQKLKTQVLEGEHSGEIIDVDFILTADVMGNITLAKLKKGDTVFLSINENEDGTTTGEVSNSWTPVERINVLVVFGIILLLILLIYGGKKGFSTSLVIIALIIFATIIIPNYAFEGSKLILSAVFAILTLIATISMINLGVNSKAIKAIAISALLVLLSFGMLVFINYITRTVGVSFEFAAVSDNVILGNVNFTHLYYVISLIIAGVFITNTVCMAIKKIERESAQTFSEKVSYAKVALPCNVIPVVATALTLYLPNHILLLTNKFSDTEIINSETLVSELNRLIAIVFCMIIAVPVVSLSCFGFGKKYLKEPAKEENANN